MTTEILSYVVLPSGTLAAILATWGFLALLMGLLHKRKGAQSPGAAPSAADLAGAPLRLHRP